MNSYQTATAFGLDGDDATRHATLQAYGLTRNRIAIADLLFLLSSRGLMVRLIRPADTGEKWAGTLINMILYLDANGTADQVTAVGEFFSHITNDRNTWLDTTNPAYAAPLRAMRLAFSDQQGMPTSADFDAILALGGGYVCGTIEQFTAEREEAEAAALSARIHGYLAEANDAAIHAIADNPQISRDELSAVWGKRLAEGWI